MEINAWTWIICQNYYFYNLFNCNCICIVSMRCQFPVQHRQTTSENVLYTARLLKSMRLIRELNWRFIFLITWCFGQLLCTLRLTLWDTCQLPPLYQQHIFGNLITKFRIGSQEITKCFYLKFRIEVVTSCCSTNIISH